MFNIQITPVVKKILLVNVIIWLITIFVPFLNLDHHFAMYDVSSDNFRPWQFITHIFMHASRDFYGDIIFSHILMNSLGLIFIGPMVERQLGEKRFLSYYLLTGFGAAAIHLAASRLYMNHLNVLLYEFSQNPTRDAFHILTDKLISRSNIIADPQLNNWYRSVYNNLSPENISPGIVEQAKSFLSLFIQKNADSKMVGASGAIYGLIAALGVMFPNTTFMLLFPPIPIKAKWLALFLGGYAFYQGIQFNPADNVGHFAHLGGAVIGAILIFQWKRKSR